jgi:hypothetical protein
MQAVRASRNIGGVLVHPPVLLDLANREADGIVVDLFWSRRGLSDEFRVEVEDRRECSSSAKNWGERVVSVPLRDRRMTA